MDDPSRADHELRAQACLEAELGRVRDELETVEVRPAIQPVYRHADDGPCASEVSALMWKDGNVVDALVFPVWANGVPVPVAELEQMIKQALETFVEDSVAQGGAGGGRRSSG